jgi:hypothetical protein
MKSYLIFTILLCTFLIGCTTQKLFYWGNYSETLYAFKKSPDEKTTEAHKKSLLDIMDKSEKKHKQIPPGVYAEYGYMLMQAGQENEGLQYFDKEQTLYPESSIFIQRLKEELKRGKK